jgi:hypothetical protein
MTSKRAKDHATKGWKIKERNQPANASLEQ